MSTIAEGLKNYMMGKVCSMHALTLLSAILINSLWTGPRHVHRLSVIGHTCHYYCV